MAGLEAKVNFFKVPHGLEDAYGVNVGWFEDQRYKDNLPIAQVARWQEFGTKAGIPRRPFMHQSMMKYEKIWLEKLKSLIQKEIDKEKNINIDKALMKFGEIAKGDIQDTILSGSFTRNSPITVHGGWMWKNGKAIYIEGKGFDKPLVNEGIMVGSIQARTDKELL